MATAWTICWLPMAEARPYRSRPAPEDGPGSLREWGDGTSRAGPELIEGGASVRFPQVVGARFNRDGSRTWRCSTWGSTS